MRIVINDSDCPYIAPQIKIAATLYQTNRNSTVKDSNSKTDLEKTTDKKELEPVALLSGIEGLTDIESRILVKVSQQADSRHAVGKSYLALFLESKAYVERWLVLYISDASVLANDKSQDTAEQIYSRFFAHNKDILRTADYEGLTTGNPAEEGAVIHTATKIFIKLLCRKDQKTLFTADEHGALSQHKFMPGLLATIAKGTNSDAHKKTIKDFFDSDDAGPLCEYLELKLKEWVTQGNPCDDRELVTKTERFFGTQSGERETFLGILRNIDTYSDDIFSDVATKLNRSYQIKTFAKHNKEIVSALTQLCVAEQPVPRTHVPCEQFPAITLDVLERDTHTILEGYGKNDETVLVRIPYYFLYLYDKVVKDFSRNLGFRFLADWKSDREWKFF
ncbi:hypothetical protein BGX21_002171 [Mortierella sp. AD011]|nr:hypothetical protein BGX21_002171 [Mortierella sp. AD011]